VQFSHPVGPDSAVLKTGIQPLMWVVVVVTCATSSRKKEKMWNYLALSFVTENFMGRGIMTTEDLLWRRQRFSYEQQE
jgi:hypothetical protein